MTVSLQRDLFSLDRGRFAKDSGMDAAAANRSEALELARTAVRMAAEANRWRTATADDAYLALERLGVEDLLGNAAGSIFRGAEWNFTGRWVPSERISNHGRMIRVWKLAGVA